MTSTDPVTGDSWFPPTATEPMHSLVTIAGSKSMTNRALVLAALSDRPTIIRGALESRDTSLMVAALSQFVGSVVRGKSLRVEPRERRTVDNVTVYLGNAGTVARFVPAIAGLWSGSFHFDGDERIRSRPLSPLLSALRDLGVEIIAAHDDRPPFTVRGVGRVRGGAVRLDASQSSQFLSALLMAGSQYDEGLSIDLANGVIPNSNHVAMTIAMLQTFGVQGVFEPDHYEVHPSRIACDEVLIEPDLSSAAPFLAAAVLTGGIVRISGWPERSIQPVESVRRIFGELGSSIEVSDGHLTAVGSGQVQAADLNLSDIAELVPVLAAVLCFANGPSRIRGVGHIRGHESNRLLALATELSALGANVSETEDGLRILPARLRSGRIRTYEDHRLVQAAALVALRTPDIEIENASTVTKTFPRFVTEWQKMVTTAES